MCSAAAAPPAVKCAYAIYWLCQGVCVAVCMRVKWLRHAGVSLNGAARSGAAAQCTVQLAAAVAEIHCSRFQDPASSSLSSHLEGAA